MKLALLTMAAALFLAALPRGVQAQALFVDPDFKGLGSGVARSPWRSLDASAWTTINRMLATSDVSVFFSARNAESDDHQITATQIQLHRTDTSTHRLVLDGMSRYNGNDSSPEWHDYTGSSRFTINFVGWDAITGTTNAPLLASNITIRGFRAFSTAGKPINLWGGSNVIIEFCEVSHTGLADDGAGIQIQYARKSGNIEMPCVPNVDHNCGVSDVFIRDNIIHNTQGEGIYIGGVENQNLPAHSNITIENNTIYDVGMAGGGEGDAIDIKDGSRNVVIRGNTIYMTTPGTGRDGIVTMSGGVIERNSISNMGRAGIVLSVTWNRYPTRDGTSVRNNTVTNCGGNTEYKWSHGIVVSGSNQADQWTNLEIANNTVSGIRAAAQGDGRGIEITRFATSTRVSNNIVYNTAAEPFYAEAGALSEHDSNLYYKDAAGAIVAVYGSSSFTAKTITQFEPHSLSTNPLLKTLNRP